MFATAETPFWITARAKSAAWVRCRKLKEAIVDEDIDAETQT
jgi:hypothetical protein